MFGYIGYLLLKRANDFLPNKAFVCISVAMFSAPIQNDFGILDRFGKKIRGSLVDCFGRV